MGVLCDLLTHNWQQMTLLNKQRHNWYSNGLYGHRFKYYDKYYQRGNNWYIFIYLKSLCSDNIVKDR